MIRGLLALSLLLAACKNLPDLPPSCGNGLLERGEDCDTPDDPRCVQCGWTCATDADCADIPAPRIGADYSCGVDGFCHAPGGQLAPESGAPVFQAQSFYVTDVTGDGIADAVGIGVDSIATLSGDPAGTLAASRIVASAVAAGHPAIVDVDHDGRLDALLPTRDGVVAYASPHQAISPFAFALETIVPINVHAIVPIDGEHLALLLDDPLVANSLILRTIDLSVSPPVFDAISICEPKGFVSAGFDPATLDYYNTTADRSKPSVSITFVANANDGAQTPEFCGISIVEDTSTTPVTFTSVRTTPQPPPSARAVLAQLDNSTCPSVVDSSGGLGALVVHPGIRNPDTSCALSFSSYTLPALAGEPGDHVIGRVRLDPPPATGPAGPDALVVPGGIYAVDQTSVQPYYVADRPLTAAASGDLDRDGRVDAVATGNDASIDVLYRVVSPSDGFILGRIATDNVPSDLTVADFDGNGAADISYVETQPNKKMALEVVYSTPSGLLPAIEAADFTSVIATVPIALPDSADPAGAVSGLAVQETRVLDMKADQVVSGFHGSVDRALIPFFDLRGAKAPSAFLAVAGGRFVSATATAFDQLAFEVPDPSDPDQNTRLWRFAGGDTGAIVYPIVGISTGPSGATDIALELGTTSLAIGDCSRARAGFCADTSRTITWPGATSDVMIAVDGQSAVAVIVDPVSLTSPLAGAFTFPPAGPGSVVSLPAQALPMPTGSDITAMFAADLDGDGTNELVIAYRAGQSGLLDCTVGAGGLACTDLVSAAAIPDTGCWLAAPGRFSPPDRPASKSIDLVVLCDAGAYRIYDDASVQRLAAQPLALAMPSNVDAIGAADVTGDRLDDLLVLATDPDGQRRLHVFPQLSAREVR